MDAGDQGVEFPGGGKGAGLLGRSVQDLTDEPTAGGGDRKRVDEVDGLAGPAIVSPASCPRPVA